MISFGFLVVREDRRIKRRIPIRVAGFAGLGSPIEAPEKSEGPLAKTVASAGESAGEMDWCSRWTAKSSNRQVSCHRSNWQSKSRRFTPDETAENWRLTALFAPDMGCKFFSFELPVVRSALGFQPALSLKGRLNMRHYLSFI